MQEHIYLAVAGEFVKIGRSKEPKDRMRTLLNSAHPDLSCRPRLAHTMLVSDSRRFELALHQRFADQRVVGEWFSLSGADVEWICRQSNADLQKLADDFGVRLFDKPYYQPPLQPVDNDPVIRLRLDPAVMADLRELADLERRKIVDQVRWIIDQQLPGLLRDARRYNG